MTEKKDAAKAGFYWNDTTGKAVRLKSGDALPEAPAGTRFLRLPAPLLLLLSPALGLAFILFIPVFTFLVVPALGARKLWSVVTRDNTNAREKPAVETSKSGT